MFAQLMRLVTRRVTTGREPGDLASWGRIVNRSARRVDEGNALSYSPIWAAVRIISESIAAIPWHVHRRLAGGGRELADDSPVDFLISRRPNPEISSLDFRRVLMGHALTYGNGYAEIERDVGGRPLALWPLGPDLVKPGRASDGELLYLVREPDQAWERATPVPARSIFHVKGLSFDGLCGYSVISFARQTIGLGLSLETFGASLFGNSSRPSGLLKFPGKLTKEAGDELLQRWEEKLQGSRINSTALLHGGLDWQQMSIPPEDAQFLETRRFQVEDVSRWYRVPAHLLSDTSRSTFSNIEQQRLEFVTDTLLTWARVWEQEADWKLFGRSLRHQLFTRLNFGALLRGDTAARSAWYTALNRLGVLSVNEIRELEELNPIAGGDLHLVEANRISITDAGKPRPEAVSGVGEQAGDAGDDDADDQADDQAGDGGQRWQRVAERLALGEIAKVVRREARAVSRARGKYKSRQTFMAWADRFYGDAHELAVDLRSALAGHAGAVSELVGGEHDAEQLAAVRVRVDALAAEHLVESRAGVARAYDDDLDGLVELWEIERPARLARDAAARALAILGA